MSQTRLLYRERLCCAQMFNVQVTGLLKYAHLQGVYFYLLVQSKDKQVVFLLLMSKSPLPERSDV